PTGRPYTATHFSFTENVTVTMKSEQNSMRTFGMTGDALFWKKSATRENAENSFTVFISAHRMRRLMP
ncbi:MAG: hypothetical protein IJ334_09865, partial [Clostridia bacterium]|nr:hypothetical protein [Clostridia bacterium]